MSMVCRFPPVTIKELLAGVLYGVKYCRQKVRQKMRQKISVIKTNSFDNIKK
jgi:hypothetical protein